MDLKLYIVEDNHKFNRYDYLNQFKEYVTVINTTGTVFQYKNIFYLNNFLCEFTAFWYIWKNFLYSEYIGFSHYRRLIDLNEKDKLNEYDYICGDRTSWYDGVFFPILRSCSFENTFNKYLYNYDSNMYDVYREVGSNVNGRGLFITRYENFEEMTRFMFGCLDSILNNQQYSVNLFLHTINSEIERNINTCNAQSWYTKFSYNDYNIYRMFAFMLEYLSGLYIEYDCKVNNKSQYCIKTPQCQF